MKKSPRQGWAFIKRRTEPHCPCQARQGGRHRRFAPVYQLTLLHRHEADPQAGVGLKPFLQVA